MAPRPFRAPSGLTRHARVVQISRKTLLRSTQWASIDLVKRFDTVFGVRQQHHIHNIDNFSRITSSALARSRLCLGRRPIGDPECRPGGSTVEADFDPVKLPYRSARRPLLDQQDPADASASDRVRRAINHQKDASCRTNPIE